MFPPLLTLAAGSRTAAHAVLILSDEANRETRAPSTCRSARGARLQPP
jgi:hypothetical protein